MPVLLQNINGTTADLIKHLINISSHSDFIFIVQLCVVKFIKYTIFAFDDGFKNVG